MNFQYSFSQHWIKIMSSCICKTLYLQLSAYHITSFVYLHLQYKLHMNILKHMNAVCRPRFQALSGWKRREGLVSARFRILLIYFRTLVTLKFTRYQSVDLLAAYGDSYALIQRLMWSYKWNVRAPVESVDEKKRLPIGKTIARGNLGS